MADPMFSQDSSEGEKSAQWEGHDAKSISSFNLNSIFSKKFTEEEQENFLAWKRRADKGFADAQFRIGLCYEEGNGVEKSYKFAFHYYKLAADQGYTAAQVFLAILYEEGLGTEQSYSQAIRKTATIEVVTVPVLSASSASFSSCI